MCTAWYTQTQTHRHTQKQWILWLKYINVNNGINHFLHIEHILFLRKGKKAFSVLFFRSHPMYDFVCASAKFGYLPVHCARYGFNQAENVHKLTSPQIHKTTNSSNTHMHTVSYPRRTYQEPQFELMQKHWPVIFALLTPIFLIDVSLSALHIPGGRDASVHIQTIRNTTQHNTRHTYLEWQNVYFIIDERISYREFR